jgi:hypothetical protein
LVPCCHDCGVYEKIIKTCDESACAGLTLRLAELDVLAAIATDAYGNYVVQTALTVAPAAVLPPILSSLDVLLPQLRLLPFGRKVEAKMTSAHRKLSAAVQASHPALAADTTQPIAQQAQPNAACYAPTLPLVVDAYTCHTQHASEPEVTTFFQQCYRVASAEPPSGPSMHAPRVTANRGRNRQSRRGGYK